MASKTATKVMPPKRSPSPQPESSFLELKPDCESINLYYTSKLHKKVKPFSKWKRRQAPFKERLRSADQKLGNYIHLTLKTVGQMSSFPLIQQLP